MAIQTTIAQYSAPAIPGMVDGVGPHLTRSYAAQGAIAPGRAVVLGTNPAKQVAQASTATGQGALVVGFAIHSYVVEQDANGLVQYADKGSVPVRNFGRLWVNTQKAVAAGSVARLHLASGSFTDAAASAGVVEDITQLNVRFVTSTTAAGLAIIEIK